MNLGQYHIFLRACNSISIANVHFNTLMTGCKNSIYRGWIEEYKVLKVLRGKLNFSVLLLNI